MIKIIGAKSNIKNINDFLQKLNNIAGKEKILIQVFNADYIFGKNHLISSYEHAKRAFLYKTNTTNSIEMEILLYASGERQIKTAIPKIGIKEKQSNIAFIFIYDKKYSQINKTIDKVINELKIKRDDSVLKGDINTLKLFGLTDKIINTVIKSKYEDLILEKVALVDIIK